MPGGDDAYDALVVVSFGGPEGPEDVMPFLENVTRGRNVPRARLDEVAARYRAFGGVSPINAANRALVAALERRFAVRRIGLPVYWGNRNWHPFLTDTVRTMADHGVRRALAFVTSAYSSYSSCRQYLDDIERARAAAAGRAPAIERIRPFWNHPGFIDTMAEQTREALAELGEPGGQRAQDRASARRTGATPPDRRAAAPDAATLRIVFTAHSIPAAMARSCDYECQLREAAELVAGRLEPPRRWDLAYQSRSGPPEQAWLGPDIVEHLGALRAAGVEHAVAVPIGFVADHMEVVYDLDVEAAAAAERLGIGFTRAHTAGTAPRFIETVCDLVLERLEGRPPAWVGRLGPRPVPCAAGCCPPVEISAARPTRPSG
jgi:ferrochelatase